MKNFWLDRKGPKKTKINIWLGVSDTEEPGQLLESFEVVIPKTEVVFLRNTRDGEKGVYDVTRYNPMTIIPYELDNMLYHRRIGKALAKRYEEGVFSGHPVKPEVMRAQWKPGPGEKLMSQFGCLFVKAADPRVEQNCPTVIIEK